MNPQPSSSDPDRRKHRRLSEIFVVAYRLKAIVPLSVDFDAKEFAGVGVDISEAGLGIDLAEPIADTASVRMKFHLVNDLAQSPAQREHIFQLEGECRYCEPISKESYRAGLLFKGLTEEERQFIAAYVKDQMLAKVEYKPDGR